MGAILPAAVQRVEPVADGAGVEVLDHGGGGVDHHEVPEEVPIPDPRASPRIMEGVALLLGMTSHRIGGHGTAVTASHTAAATAALGNRSPPSLAPRPTPASTMPLLHASVRGLGQESDKAPSQQLVKTLKRRLSENRDAEMARTMVPVSGRTAPSSPPTAMAVPNHTDHPIIRRPHRAHNLGMSFDASAGIEDGLRRRTFAEQFPEMARYLRRERAAVRRQQSSVSSPGTAPLAPPPPPPPQTHTRTLMPETASQPALVRPLRRPAPTMSDDCQGPQKRLMTGLSTASAGTFSSVPLAASSVSAPRGQSMAAPVPRAVDSLAPSEMVSRDHAAMRAASMASDRVMWSPGNSFLPGASGPVTVPRPSVPTSPSMSPSHLQFGQAGNQAFGPGFMNEYGSFMGGWNPALMGHQSMSCNDLTMEEILAEMAATPGYPGSQRWSDRGLVTLPDLPPAPPSALASIATSPGSSASAPPAQGPTSSGNPSVPYTITVSPSLPKPSPHMARPLRVPTPPVPAAATLKADAEEERGDNGAIPLDDVDGMFDTSDSEGEGRTSYKNNVRPHKLRKQD